MPTLTNSLEGGSNGTTVSNANSGGASGSAFDTVSTVSGGTLAYDNTRAAHGGLSLKVATSTTAGASSANWTTSLATQTVQTWFRLYCYFTANPAATINIFRFNNSSSGNCAMLQLGTGGLLLWQNAAFSNITGTTFTNAIPLNAWFRIEGFVFPSTTVGQVSASLYTSMDSATALETKTSAATQVLAANLAQGLFGTVTSVASVTAFWVDDLGVST